MHFTISRLSVFIERVPLHWHDFASVERRNEYGRARGRRHRFRVWDVLIGNLRIIASVRR